MNAPKKIGAAACVLCLAAVLVLQLAVTALQAGSGVQQSNYPALEPDETQGDPLIGLNHNFTPNKSFATNLPIVVLDVAADPDAQWAEGTLLLYGSADGGTATLHDTPAAESRIRIQRRSDGSVEYDKPQYSLVTLQDDGTENPLDLLGMGADSKWVLSGSMEDKSLLRNYLASRIASEIQPETPDCRFCEVFLKKDGVSVYQGVYLLAESVSRGENRINIDDSAVSYLVQRSSSDTDAPVLDTWGQANGLYAEDQRISVVYQDESELADHALDYITADLSHIEQVICSEDSGVFQSYSRYIDVDSFVDHFLLNEFFGNYGSGDDTTYLWKNVGGKLHIGPAWGFEQAMNNASGAEQDPDALGMAEQPLFRQLIRDKKFLDKLSARYAALRRSTLSEEHVFAVLEEARQYVASAQQRDWYRWAADYQDSSGTNPHSYYLQSYKIGKVKLQRNTTRYEQELYNIRTYLSAHGAKISVELKALEDDAAMNAGTSSTSALLLVLVMLMFLLPSYILNRRK